MYELLILCSNLNFVWEKIEIVAFTSTRFEFKNHVLEIRMRNLGFPWPLSRACLVC